ncbi:MAG: ATP-binding protein [Spirochaetales bacterium]|nr:ATP-binding protein [Spirochaetales bacterium]
MQYIKRAMESSIIKASTQYPVVMVCGQRQTGKSTMLRHLAEPDRVCVSFDKLETRTLAENDPALFFETYGHKLLIDEFQRVPSILLAIKDIVDNAQYNGENPNGMFWLTGSQKFVMMKNISETLAGRVAVFSLLPLSQREIDGKESEPFCPEIEALKSKDYENKTLSNTFERIFQGGMPKLLGDKTLDRDLYFSSYMDTYIERDVSALEQVGKLDEFRALVTYLAANTAQELKYESISRDIGVSAPTVKEWVTILQRSGIIYILRPYYNNINRRLVKTPKCYFLDTGLAAYLTRWPTYETLMNGNASGAFFETFVVGEILKSYYNCGKEPNIYYYRDIDKKEIDLLMVGSNQVFPIEIKKSKTPSEADKNFSVLDKLGLKVMPGLVLCMADEFFPIKREVWLCPITMI